MNKIKTLLVSGVGKLTKDEIYNFSKLPYTKVILLYSGKKEMFTKVPSKLKIIKYNNLIDLNVKINQVFKDNAEYKIVPYFVGDSNSKYAIKIYNKSFGTNIDPKIFKEKDKMVNFLGDIAKKKYIRFRYKDLINTDYNEIKWQIGDLFIVKPTNASSSTNTFKIKGYEDFENIKVKLAKGYDYIIEEYIGGNLFSIDFYFDGGNMYLLTFVREIAMIDIIEENKLTSEYQEKYIDELNKHFNFVLPIRYNNDFGKLSKHEFAFLDDIKNKLKNLQYRGFIHLEYKYEKSCNKIGFIEWGARLGWSRNNYIKRIYNTDVYKIPYYLLIEKDSSRFIEIRKGIYQFKEYEHNINLVGIKTNFVESINYVELLKNTGNILNVSFKDFIFLYYKEKFGIKINNINFKIKHTKNYDFYPFYKNNSTRFDYILELDDENFLLFKKKKFRIIEDIFFHDYK